MSYSYKFDTTISSSEFAEDMAERASIIDVSQFLNVLAEQLETRHEVEEDTVIVLLAEDVFFNELAKGLRDALTRAQEKVKSTTRKAFQQPTHEEIEKKISLLMHAGRMSIGTDVGELDQHSLPSEMRSEYQKKHIEKTTNTLIKNMERMQGDLEYRRQQGDPTV
jgi:hypothetical protein